jgi:hypothetical protein
MNVTDGCIIYFDGKSNDFVETYSRDAIPDSYNTPFHITRAGTFRAFQSGSLHVHEDNEGDIRARGRVDTDYEWLKKASIVTIKVD